MWLSREQQPRPSQLRGSRQLRFSLVFRAVWLTGKFTNRISSFPFIPRFHNAVYLEATAQRLFTQNPLRGLRMCFVWRDLQADAAPARISASSPNIYRQPKASRGLERLWLEALNPKALIHWFTHISDINSHRRLCDP